MATKKDIDNIMSQLKSIGERLGKMETADQEVKNMMGDITTKLAMIGERLEKAENSAEEKERQRSIVMIGLPESHAVKASERAKEDARAVEEVLDELGVEGQPVAVYRMGQRMMERRGPRLLKVVMPASVFLRITLGEWKKNRERMKEHEKWARLLIRPSLSPEELKLDKEERQRRWAQRNGGGTGTNAEHVTERKK